MEMRLGKTVVTVHYLTTFLPREINLVVCPYSVLGTWEKELKLFGVLDYEYEILTGKRDLRIEKVNTDRKWFILNYEMAERLNILSYRFDNLIVDESVALSNPMAKLTKYFLKYRPLLKRVWLLAGKIAPKGDCKQMITQLILLNGKCLGKSNYYEVRNEYFEQIHFDWQPKKGTEALLNEELHKTCFVLSRKEAGLPDEKIYSVRKVPMCKPQARDYKLVLEKFAVEEVETDYHMGQRILLQQIAGGWDVVNGSCYSPNTKLRELIYLLTGDLKGEQVLIWCKFIHEVELVSQALLKAGIWNKYIIGEIKNREEIRDLFQAGKLQVVIANKALAKGTDWSAANWEIFFSCESSYDLRSQMEDRVYNVNKKHPLGIIDLQSEGSIDEIIYEGLEEDKTGNHFTNSKLLRNLKEQALCLK